MNSFKKIGALLAVTLTVGALSTLPANAAALAVKVNGNANTTTAVSPVLVNTPYTNVIDETNTVAITADADAATNVTFTASSNVKLVINLNTALVPVSTANGSFSYGATSTGRDINVYAYTTSSTTVGYVTVNNGSYSTVVYLKGLVGPAYNVRVSAGQTAALGTTTPVTFSVSDVFGNPVGGETVNAAIIAGTFSDLTQLKSFVTESVTSSTTVLGAKTDNVFVSTPGSLTILATGATGATAVVGLPAPVKSANVVITVSDLNAIIGSLSNQVTTLTKTVADNKAAAEKALADAKVASDAALAKALADAKVASDAALAKAIADAKAVSDKALADAIAASDKALADATAAHKAEYNALVVKYNNLVRAHIAKAKKYKFSTNLTLATRK